MGQNRSLAFAELEAAASTLLTVLFAFNHAAVASKVSVGLKGCVSVLVNLEQSAADSVQASGCLAVQSAALNCNQNVKLVVTKRGW